MNYYTFYFIDFTSISECSLNQDPQWAETGDRYLLKLFRDYVFHQVSADGRPWLDMSHVVYTLNRLDAGTVEKVCLIFFKNVYICVCTKPKF